MKIFGGTSPGKKRQNNEDYYAFGLLKSNAYYAILCDGMGGENCGEVASKLATEVIEERLINSYNEKMDQNSIRNLLISTINIANTEVYEKSKTSPDFSGMGTTVIAVIIKDNNAHIAHVGDSRGYLVNESIQQITKDHSFVQMLLESGNIDINEAKNHPDKNLITRALGVEEELDIDYNEIELHENDMILLCSDGLTNMCSDDEILSVIQSNKGETVCDELISKANNSGGIDNITTILIK